MQAYCTACGVPRMPLAGTSVNLAGQPSQVGGVVTRVLGWLVLGFGTLLAAGTFATCSAVVGPAAVAPFIFAIPLAIATWVLSYYLLKGGKQLEKAGVDKQNAARAQAVYALANTRGGMVTSEDLARAIAVTTQAADDMLTRMAKESPEHVSIEVDDDGHIFYRFAAAHWAALDANPASMSPNRASWAPWQPASMAQNAPAAAPAARQRVAPPQRVADTLGQNVRVEPRDPLEDELAAEPDVARRSVR